MNAKQKEILQVQRSLLSRNIVWTPTLAANLKANNLLTDAMIAQIDAAEGPENKILVMLDLLPLRTSQVYDKFAAALHLSGHTLLADFLREEDMSKQPLNTKDLFKRLPFLAKNMKETEKKLIENYMSEKIQSAILSHTWQWDTKEKDKALVAKQEQLEQAHEHEQEMRKKQEEVLEAQRREKEAREEILTLKAELRALSENSTRLQQHLKGQMDTQMRFSIANDNIAQRLNQKLQAAEETLRQVQDKLQSVIKLSPHDQEHDLMRLADNPYCFLPDDVDLFLAQFKKLLVVQLKYEDLMEERNYVLTHLGLPPGERPDEDAEQASLLKAYQDFASRNDERIERLQKEVERYGDLLQDATKTKEEEDRRMAAAGTVWQNAIMSVMRKQLQDLKATLRKKDTTLSIKDAEIVKLRSRVSELEQALAAKTQEAELAARAVNTVELHNGYSATSAHSLDAGTGTGTGAGTGAGGGPGPSVSPKPRSNNNNHNHHHNNNNGGGQGLPPLRASSVSHKPSSSPRAAGIRAPRLQVSVPRGIIVESDTPLTRYPAGLTTTQLRVHHEDAAATAVRQPPPPASSDPRAKPQMGSTLGDLKAMHAHARFSVSRGGGGGGGGGGGLEAPNPLPNKQLTSPTPRRKLPAKVK